MTEQELQEIKERNEAGLLHHYEIKELLDEVERLSKENDKLAEWGRYSVHAGVRALEENEKLRKQVEFNKEYGIYSNAMKEIERLRKGIERIAECTDCIATRVEANKLLAEI